MLYVYSIPLPLSLSLYLLLFLTLLDLRQLDFTFTFLLCFKQTFLKLRKDEWPPIVCLRRVCVGIQSGGVSRSLFDGMSRQVSQSEIIQKWEKSLGLSLDVSKSQYRFVSYRVLLRSMNMQCHQTGRLFAYAKHPVFGQTVRTLWTAHNLNTMLQVYFDTRN